VDEIDATVSGLACAFQIVSKARIFKTLQALPAIGGLHYLCGDIAGQAVTGPALEHSSQRRNELSERYDSEGKHNPGGERGMGNEGIKRGCASHRSSQPIDDST